MQKRISLFISSPGDVGRERHATAEIIRRLQSEFAEHCTLDPYFWEWEPVDFSKDYQANIPSTADFDIVICILWSRLGSRLSDQHKLPPPHNRPANSGTEYELLHALHGQKQHPERLPDLLVWKNESPPPPASAPPLDKEERNKRIAQSDALQDFLTSVTKDSVTGSFIAALNSYQYLDQFEELMETKLRKLIQKHIGQHTIKPKPQWHGSPFRDLDVFEFQHAPIFFGRSRAIGEVVRLLQTTLSKPERCHFALILGASGSGKSSLARAGVLPLLTRPGVIEGIGLWRCAIVRPSDDSADVFQALAAALLSEGKKIYAGIPAPNQQPPALPELADPESSAPQQSLAAELRAHPQTVAIRVKDQLSAAAKAHQTQQLHTLEAQIASLTQEGRQADAALKQQALQSLQEPKARLVLLLDQMEELFTLNYAPEQLRSFLETIAVLARSGRVFVIGTLRSDFYPRYQEQPTLVALARDGARFDLLPPTPDEISQIIRRPASLAALQFEPHPTTAEHTLADTLRDEALADPEALPLLEHVLNRLYQAQLPRADGRLTFADYEEICGVDVDPNTGVKTSRGVGGALGKHAEDIFTGQHRQPTAPPPPWTEETFRAVFRCLVTFGKGEGDTDVPNRRAFTYQDLIQSHPAAQALVDTFIHERLLIADTDAQSRAIVRLSHEALLTRWPRLANWLQTAPVRDLMSQRRRLESSLRQWQEQSRTPDCYLQPGFELEEGKQLLEKHESALKQEEREFIRESVKYHAERQRAEKERERIATRWRQRMIAGLSVLTLVALVTVLIAWVQAERTKVALAESNRQLERSQVEEGRAWLERGRAAWNRGDHLSALMLAGRALGYQGYGPVGLQPPSSEVAFPPLLSTRMKNATAEKERAEEAQKVKQFIDSVRPTLLPLWVATLPGTVKCVTFSPDGCRLACRCGSEDSDVIFTAGNTIMSHGKDAIKLWDTASGKEIGSLRGQMKSVTSVAFGSDGSRIVSGCIDGTIKLWDAASGKELASLAGHTNSVTSVAFSPDGSRIVSGSEPPELGGKASIKLWDVASGNELAEIQDQAISFGYVTMVTFSPDGSLIASVCGTIKLWDAVSGTKLACLQEDEQYVTSIVFSPDGSRIAGGSMGGTVKVWEVASGKELANLQGHTDSVTSVAFSPDGSRLVSGSTNGTVKLWEVASRREFANLQGHRDSVTSVAFSPDGSRLVSGSKDRTIKLWDTASEKELVRLQGWTGRVSTVAYSPDGSRLASNSDLTTIKLWDTASGRELASLPELSVAVMRIAFSPDGSRLAAYEVVHGGLLLWDTATGKELTEANERDRDAARQWLASAEQRLSPDHRTLADDNGQSVFIVPNGRNLDLTTRLRSGLLAMQDRELQFPEIKQTTPMLHVRQDTLAQLADPKLSPERRAELRMELCTKSSQFRAATALWQRLLQGEWPGFEGATVPKDQAPATIPADSPIRRLYLLALIDATKNPQIHGHPTICQTAAQIAPVLTKEMMATPTISLAMMSLMQTLTKDDSPAMSAPRAALLKRLEEVATKEWLAVLQGTE